MLLSALPLVAPATGYPYVLVVDDDERCRQQVIRVVESAGHRCLSAHNGVEALERCAARRPRIVLTDLAMPELGGAGLVACLSTRYPSLPVVVITGQDPGDPEMTSLHAVVKAILAKPVDPERLLALLLEILGEDAEAATT